MFKTIQTRRSTKESIERIDNYLETTKEYVSITKISSDLNLHFNSVKKYIETLSKFGRVIIATNGNTTLVKFKETKKEVKNEPTN